MRTRVSATRFARIMLTMGSGESHWLIVAFVLGAIALGVLSNFVFSAAFSPGSITYWGTIRALGVVVLFVTLAYGAFTYDVETAGRPGLGLVVEEELARSWMQTGSPCHRAWTVRLPYAAAISRRVTGTSRS